MENTNQTHFTKKFIILLLLVIIGRVYDATTTYFYTPNLTNESNIIIKYLGAGWTSFLILQILLTALILFLLYYYVFKYKQNTPADKNLNLKQFASYLYFNDTVSFNKLFYRIPKNKKALCASIGYIVSMTLIVVSYIVGTSTTFLLISDSYKEFYKQGITTILYITMFVIAVWFTINFFKIEYKKYQKSHSGDQ